uniref:Uncharacterized protein n=1 Tax=Meloidogyne enterolobii TaxID=390850 RepID=A0A6V7TR48_MELEN|nr:unnamed protein product [Meloidogyne enterolobii]
MAERLNHNIPQHRTNGKVHLRQQEDRIACLHLLACGSVRRVPPLEDIDDELIEEPQINGEDGGDNNDGFILAKKKQQETQTSQTFN